MTGIVLHASHVMLGKSCIHCTGCTCHHSDLLAKVCTEKQHQLKQAQTESDSEGGK